MIAAEITTDLGAPSWTRVEGTLMSTARAVRRAYDHVFSEIDLNLSEASVLAHLADSGPITQVELARRIGNSRARIGVNVDTLEGKGAVMRRADPQDRRVWLVGLTPTGRQLWERSVELDVSLRRRMRHGTTAAARDQLDTALRQIEQNVAALLAGEPDAASTPPSGSERTRRGRKPRATSS